MRRWMGALAVLACAGCATNRYGTARVLPDGASSHVVSIDAVAVRRDLIFFGVEYELEADPTEGWWIAPVALPMYTWRRGLGGDLELGLGFGPFLGAAADLKIELLRSEHVDLAIAPTAGAQLPLPYIGGGLYLGAPLLLGVNVSQPISFLAQLSPHAFATTFGAAAWLSGSVGAQFRLTEEFALQPAAALHGIPTREAPFFTAGVALAFGRQPDFAPPPAPPPGATDFWDPPER